MIFFYVFLEEMILLDGDCVRLSVFMVHRLMVMVLMDLYDFVLFGIILRYVFGGGGGMIGKRRLHG